MNVTTCAESGAGRGECAVDEEFDRCQIGGRGTHIARKGDEIAAGLESDAFGFHLERTVLGHEAEVSGMAVCRHVCVPDKMHCVRAGRHVRQYALC